MATTAPDSSTITTAGLSQEFWGYVMWGMAGLAVAGPELAAAFDLAPWPTISVTVGHLSDMFAGTRIIVVAALVFAAYFAVPRMTARRLGAPEPPSTPGGRATPATEPVPVLTTWTYVVAATLSLVVGVILAERFDTESFAGAYILYGLIATVWFVIPSLLAEVAHRDVQFPTLLRTIADLGRRAPYLAPVVLAGLVVLTVHLAFFPWPDW